MLLEIRDGIVSRGGETILSHFNFEIKGTEKIAVVGRNGAGKTTLLNVLAGYTPLDRNEKNQSSGLRMSRTCTIGMLTQHAPTDVTDLTVEENILVSIGVKSNFAAEQYSKERYDYEQRFDRMLTGFGLSKEDKGRRIGTFSGGEQIKIRLISLLLAEPDVLILDEPTNHLDLTSVEWLEEYLRSYPKAVVMVSHDRYFIDRTAEVIWEVTGAKTVRYPGNYSQYRKEKAEKYQKQLKAWESQQEEMSRLNDLIEKFKHKPNKAAFARSRKKILERMEKVEKPERDDAVLHTGEILPARAGSKWVYECEHLRFGYPAEPPAPLESSEELPAPLISTEEPPVPLTSTEEPPALGEISFRLRRGQKIGIMGPNGTGKTTFLKTVAGLLAPVKGKGGMGVNIDAVYFDQMSAQIDDPRSIFDWFHEKFPSLTGKEIRDTLTGYLFRGSDLGKQVKTLSGGEKVRLVLASILQSGPNFLILDEPTNNMDIPAKETLESVFRDYKGTILFVSHDRYFLSHVADALLVFEPGQEQVMYYPFGYDHYQERRRKALYGSSVPGLRSAEDQSLIEDLRAVPEAEKHRLREISTAEATRDWEFSLNKEERAKAEAAYAAAWEQYVLADQVYPDEIPESAEDFYNWLRTDPSAPTPPENVPPTPQETALRAASEAWTQTCIAYYDLWLETQPEEEENE